MVAKFINKRMKNNFQDVLSFWVKKGVDGFRIDAIDTLWENNYDKDAPLSNKPGTVPVSETCLTVFYTCSVLHFNSKLIIWQNDILQRIFVVLLYVLKPLTRSDF